MGENEQPLPPSLGTDQPTAVTDVGSPIVPAVSRTSEAVPAEAPDQKSAASVIETVIKLLGVAGAMSTAMGLPAVYLHFKRLGLPTFYIDYEQVLSAGILPTVLLAVIALYFWEVLRRARRGEESKPLVGAVAIPLLLPTLPILVLGMVAYVLLCVWGSLWLIMLPFRQWGVLDLTNRELLYGAASLSAVGSLAYVFRERLLLFKPVCWLLTHFAALSRRFDDDQSSSRSERPLPVDSSKQTKTQEQNAREWLPLLSFLWPGVTIMFIGLLFAIKGVLYLWEPPLARVLPGGAILWAGIGLGFGYGLGLSSIASLDFLKCESRRLKNIGLAILMLSLVLTGGFSITLYSSRVYPALSQGWGGGRPERATVWIDRKALPPVEEMRRCLPSTSVSVEDDVVRVDSTLVLRAGKETILLVDSSATTPGLALPIGSLKMVALARDE